MEQVVVKLQEWIALYGLRVIAAAAILVLGRFAAKGIRAIIRRMLQKAHIDETLVSFMSSLCYVGIMAFVIVAALGQLGVQTASFVAILGAAGLAIGLALQGSLANFAAGVLMVIFRPFKVGDYIEGGGAEGVVEEIGIFTTNLNSVDNKKIIVPNAKMTNGNIVNYTAKDIRRVDLVASVSYREDLNKVKKVLEGVLAKEGRILKDPAPAIGVLELAKGGVNFAVRPWVKTSDYWDVFFAIQENIKTQFDAEGLRTPSPQQDVYLHKVEAWVDNER
jgi:small conductance mechanosensitive channel